MEKERLELDLSLIELNEGQLSWLPKNPRTWTQTDIDKTAASIKQDPDFLEDRPLLVVSREDSPNLVVFAGNLRSVGARAARLSRVPCVLYSPEEDEDYETIRRRAMKDNGSFGQFDWDEVFSSPWGQMDLDAMGIGKAFQQGGDPFNESPKDEAEDKPQAQEDDFDENADAIQVRCKPGDIWQLGEHRLMCGDSIDLEQVKTLMGGAIADMVLTDPPYGMFLDTDFSTIRGSLKCIGRKNKTQGNKYDKVIGDNEDFKPELITSIFKNFPKCKEVFLFGADYFAELLPQKNKGSWLCWDKRKGSQADAIGSEFELIWSKNKHKRRMLRHDWFGFLSSQNQADARNRVHPTQKPVTLIADIINQWGKDADIIVDLYGGSGTTIIAAEQTGRKCYMMELDPYYCDIIIARWEKLTGKTAVKITA